ncbi:hypothetical protein LJC32_04665 [Oscillospiraceae bacterium OttesenSCG-928-F05]|nr:hypothetical protein [Oscillospiraceae bacterium OttesenSCG-928-F05]
MKKFKPMTCRLLTAASMIACAFALWPTGVHCRTWLYEPPRPAKLQNR